MKIHKLMTQQVWTVPAKASLHDALHLMWTHDIGALPVVDADQRVIGMVTDRDVAMATYHHNRTPRSLRVQETMSSTVRACQPGDSIAVAEEVMRLGQVRRLPVVDGEMRLLGMISLADLASHATTDDPTRATNGVERTLGAITKPRATAGAPQA